MLFTVFPVAFAPICRRLFVPLHLTLLGNHASRRGIYLWEYVRSTNRNCDHAQRWKPDDRGAPGPAFSASPASFRGMLGIRLARDIRRDAPSVPPVKFISLRPTVAVVDLLLVACGRWRSVRVRTWQPSMVVETSGQTTGRLPPSSDTFGTTTAIMAGVVCCC